ncbi:MAG: VWA domain-containing protein [bacterium]|nr:VWA domain-containing protein [bacterium]
MSLSKCRVSAGPGSETVFRWAAGSRFRRGPIENNRRRRGLVAVQVAVLLTVILGFAALTIDVGAMYNAQAELQRTADAAALAAASLLGEFQAGNPIELARTEAVNYVAQNRVWGRQMIADPNVDVTFGRANYNATENTYSFTPTTTGPDAVQVRVRLTEDSPNGPLNLFFASVLGRNHANLSAGAIAMMVPRDITIVADLSGSMNDDSELRNVHNQEVNLFDVWSGLPLLTGRPGIANGFDPPTPGDAPSAGDLQPATGPGLPGHVGGNPNPANESFSDSEDHGPRWGWMTTWGTKLTPNVYDPVGDTGLFYIPRNQDTTDAEVIQNLIESGYSAQERAALLSGANDGSSTAYTNRVRVMLGLAGWRSGMEVRKYSSEIGNADAVVGSSELTQKVAYPFAQGAWDQYLSYMKGKSKMVNADAGFHYRYGTKTLVNFLMEKKPQHDDTPELALTPAQPVQAVKDAVGHLVQVITTLGSDDQVSLEIYGQSVHHEQDLVGWGPGGAPDYQAVPDRLDAMQAAHYDVWTNMGGGIAQGIAELTESGRQRAASRKIMILLTDGRANVSESGQTGDYPGGGLYALAQAQAAADLGIRIFAVSHGFGADQDLMRQIAVIGSGQHFHAEGSIDEYSDQLEAIFNTLGGQRPVELIK